MSLCLWVRAGYNRAHTQESRTHMHDSIQGLGWFVRRTSNTAAVGRFYRDALGLPVLRQWDAAESAGYMFYAGDVAAFEINRGGQPPISDPAQAECTPIFRTRDSDTALKQALAVGGKVVDDSVAKNIRTVLISDVDGHLFGLRQADDVSQFPPDKEAARRWAAGERGLAGLAALPDCIQDLGTVRLRVEDPAAMATFYTEMLGLDLLGHFVGGGIALHVGGTGILELVPGGTRHSPPKDRVDVTDVWILRVYDYVAMKAHFAVNRVHQVNALELAGGWLDYYTDPEGHLFGFQERKAPDPAILNSNLIEDKAARQKWLAN
jgi:predicted enzyme related to lactoylglutathione lyase